MLDLSAPSAAESTSAGQYRNADLYEKGRKEEIMKYPWASRTSRHQHGQDSARTFWRDYSFLMLILLFAILRNMRYLMQSIRRYSLSAGSQETPLQRSSQQEASTISPSPVPYVQATARPAAPRNVIINTAASQQPPPTPGVSKQQPLLERLSHAYKRLPQLFTHVLRIEYPLPVSVCGITLYALWERSLSLPEPPDEVSQHIGVLMDDLGLWTVVSFIKMAETPEIPASTVKRAVQELEDRLHQLYPTPAPIYLILHIEQLSNPSPDISLFYRKHSRIQDSINAQAAFVEDLQRQWELSSQSAINGWFPNKFNLYDRESHRRGWLVLSPGRALVVGVNDRQVHLLANVLQPSDTDRTHGSGILTERYRDVLSRVMQWVSNQDAFEAVDQLKDLVASGTKAIDGQVMLNFAVAGIGILLAFLLLPDQQRPERFVASMVCLSVASLWFWIYARGGRMFAQILGWFFLLFVLPCLFAWPQLVELIHWFSG
jgi:hypothetical protein